MSLNKPRPVNLDLTTIHFPLPAIASILHRITGVALFILMPVMLWLLQHSLSSPTAYTEVSLWLEQGLLKLVVLLFSFSIIYHFVAGTRHLLMDMHIGESLEGGRLGSMLVIIISALLCFGVGIYLW